ncbi:MAG: hypothetical protein ACFFHD_10240 [Promethearchaeota archaeon]
MPKKKKKEKSQKKKKDDVQKKKKEEVQKKKEELISETKEVQGYSLNNALHSVKKTETTLQTLLKGVSEEQGFVRPGSEDEKVLPHLSHESKSKIAEEFMLEDVPLTERARAQKRDKLSIEPKIKEKVKVSSKKIEKEPSKISPDTLPVSPPPQEVKPISPTDQIIPAYTEKKASSIKKEKENIYLKLTQFFEELLKGYNKRYERWENSISNILAILRKMRKITKKNTEDLIESINNLYEKIQAGLELFKVKRDEIEKIAEIDIESMSGEFKRVLGLLELQIKEYQLKRETDNLIHQIPHL